MKARKNRLEVIITKIREAERKLSEVENNLQYIKVLRSLQLWLSRLSMFQNTKEYEHYFLGGPFTIWEKVNNSILAYQYGEKPF